MSYRYRRGSIFGGVLLVFIGLLFLLHNLAPGLLPFEDVARYWPALLILWGLVMVWDRLAEGRAAASAPAPPAPNLPAHVVGRPPRRGHAADFFLILLIVVAFLAASHEAHLHPGWPSAFARFDPFATPYSYTTTLPPAPIEPSAQVSLWTPGGNINVHPQPAQNLSVIVTKTVRATSGTRAQELAEATAVSVDQTASGVQVNPRIPASANEDVSYDASLFPEAALSASTDRGDIHVNGIAGALSLRASGVVVVSHAGSNVFGELRSGDARIHSVKGNVSISGRGDRIDVGEVSGTVALRGEFFGPIRVRRIGGGLTFDSRRTSLSVDAALGRLDLDSSGLQLSDTPGNVSLQTREKDIQLENVQGALHLFDRDGSVQVRYSVPPRSDIDITNRSGDIDLVLPDGAGFSIYAVAKSGNISCDFTSPSLQLARGSSTTVLQGSVGAGGPKLTLTSTYGTIHIRRAPAAPAPPSAPST